MFKKFSFRNATNFVFKICAWLYTGSHSMFAESIHSLADTINQLILAYGIHKSVQVWVPVKFQIEKLLPYALLIVLSDCRLRPSVRLYKHEVCVVVNIWRWYILYRNWPVVLPWHPGLSESSTNRRFLLGKLIERWPNFKAVNSTQNFQAFCILGGSLISEGATLMVAVSTIRHAAKANNQTFKEYGQSHMRLTILKFFKFFF